MKFIKSMGLISIISYLFLSSNMAYAKGTLVVATNAEYAPFEFVKRGKMVGYDIDLAKKIAKDLGMKIKFLNLGFDALIPAVQANQADIVIAGLSPTPARRKNIGFSNVYYKTSQVLIFKKDKNIKSLEDLENKKLVAGVATEQEKIGKFLVKNYKAAKITGLKNSIVAFSDVKLNRADAMVLEDIQVNEFKKICANNCSILKINDKLLPNTIGSGFAIGFKKHSKLINKVNLLLEKYKSNGSLEKLYKEWILD